MNKSTAIVALLSVVTAPISTVGQTQRLDFQSGWELSGADTKVEMFHGRNALRIRSGRAVYRHLAMRDGTIEFDMEVTALRSFAYLQFRIESDGEYEDLYFRPHKSGLPDAIQYSPVYRGASNWQLYHRDGYTAAADFTPHSWIHVRVVLSGSHAAVFVGDAEEPQMLITRLARDPESGYIALRGFLPATVVDQDAYVVSYSNVDVTPGHVPFDFSSVPAAAEPTAGLVTEWSVSGPFAQQTQTIEQAPAAVMSGVWRTLRADPTGLVVFGRAVVVPQGMRPPALLARLILNADAATTKRFNFGYSDQVSVFLNGQLLFSANDSYSYDGPRRQGLIGLYQASLFLPLRRGANELVLAISDVFGGWGVMGQFPDRDGLQVVAR